MNELIQKLKPFLPEEVKILNDHGLLRLLKEDGEQCGIVDIDEHDQLIGFDLQIQLPEETGSNVRMVAERFASFFYPQAVKVVQEEQTGQSVVIQLSETDPVYQLPIPGAGMTVEIHVSGIVTAAQIYRNAYTLIENDEPLSVEKAKEKLLAEAPIVLAVQDDSAVYKLSEQAIGVHADGTVLYTELPPVLSDIKAEGKPEDWTDLMGLTDDFVNYYKEDGVQLWAEKALAEQHPIEEIPDQVAVRKNEEVLFYSGATPWTKGRRWTEEELEQQAVRFLSAVAEQPLKEWKHAGAQLAADAAIEDELEPTYIFLFAYTKEGILVEGAEASVHVGIYSGLIRECIIDRVPDAVRSVTLVSMQQVKRQAAVLLQLDPAWVALQEEAHYELVYIRKK